MFCVALVLTAYTARYPRIARVGSAMFSEALAPLQSLNRTLHDVFAGAWDRYVNLVHTKADNRRLLERLVVMEAENSRLLELESENERLRRLLAMAGEAGLRGPVARVIAYDPSNWSKKITINRGSHDGVAVGMAVVDGNGAVGQVTAVGPRSSQVLLLTDPSSGADALLQRSRGRGALEGTGGKRCRLNYVSSEEDVKVGDRVITSGLDGVFPKGLLLGVVSYVGESEKGMLFRDLHVATSVDFNKLENVLVVTNNAGETP